MRFPYLPSTLEQRLLKANLELLATRGKPQADFVAANISQFKTSKEFRIMELGDRYYSNEGDILAKKRVAIDKRGNLIEDKLLPNNKVAHPALRNTIDEKVAYFIAKPFSIKCENKTFQKILEEEIFTQELRTRLATVAKDAYKKGISYLQPSFDKDGQLYFKFRQGNSIVPFWADEEHTILDAYILFFKITIYELDGNYKDVDYIEYVDETGIYRYTLEDGDKIKAYEDSDTKAISGHFKALDDEGLEKEMVWERLPLIAFKPNADEYAVIRSMKAIIDDYDTTVSDVADQIGDLPYSIKVITNYDGQDLGELSHNLYTYRMVKVTDGGDIKNLQQTIDITSIDSHLNRLKEDMYEYGRTVDNKSAIANNASGKALDRLYNRIDLDANDTIAQFKASLEQMLWFVKWYYKSSGKGDFTNEKVEFIFNRDKPTDEETVIASCVSSKGIISDETIVANHPWVTDVQAELDRLKKEKEEQMTQFMDMSAYGQQPNGQDNTNEDDDTEEEA